MIAAFVERFDAKREAVKATLAQAHPVDYTALVKLVIETVTAEEYDTFSPDPERIHEINDGDYQGTLVFLIGEKGYQPSKYYIVSVGYGSCSGCDTLEGIRGYESGAPTTQQIDDYFTLVLHIVQKLRVATGDSYEDIV